MMALFCALHQVDAQSTPDTSTIRYATYEDANYWHNVNVGDYLLFPDGVANDPKPYPTFSPSLSLGSKILIYAGTYDRISLDGAGCQATEGQPTIITNFGGQVRVGDANIGDKKGIHLDGFFSARLTGKYDPENQTGHVSFKGHDEGRAFSSGDYYEKYGIWGDFRWSGKRGGNGLGNIVRGYGNLYLEIDYIAAWGGGFACFNLKEDSPALAKTVFLNVHDTFSGFSNGEGFYVGYSSGSAAGRDTPQLTLRNNIVMFPGGDGLQTDKLAPGSLIENNIIVGSGRDYRAPFQKAYHDNAHQFSHVAGGVTIRDNVYYGFVGNAMVGPRLVGSEEGRFIIDQNDPDPVVIENNYWGHGEGTIGFVWPSNGITPLIWSENTYGPLAYPSTDDTFIVPKIHDEWMLIHSLGEPLPFLFENNKFSPELPFVTIRDLSQEGSPIITLDPSLYYGNTAQTVVDVTFENLGFGANFDPQTVGIYEHTYENTDDVGMETLYQIPQPNGTPVTYPVGEIVIVYNNSGDTLFYECIQEHTVDLQNPNGPLDPAGATLWQQMTWNGRALPPLDVRLPVGSHYEGLGLGLSYNGVSASDPDLTPPAIKLVGGKLYVRLGESYVEPGYTAADNVDGDLTSSVGTSWSGGAFDSNTIGLYLRAYNVTDAAGNAAATVIREVEVYDLSVAPSISLVGGDYDVPLGFAYTELGYAASDPQDGDLTDQVSSTWVGAAFDPNVTGVYQIQYNVNDSDGYPAITQTRLVEVYDPSQRAAPVVFLNQGSVSLSVGDVYSEPGYTALDLNGSDVTASVVSSWAGAALDINTAGTYLRKYVATDSAGNSGTAYRVINVYPTDALFFQDFESSGNVASYVGSPASGDLLDDISSETGVGNWYIDSGALRIDRLAGVDPDSDAGFARITDISTGSGPVVFAMDLGMSNVPSTTGQVAYLELGDWSSISDYNSGGSYGDIYERLEIRGVQGTGFRFRYGSTYSPTYPEDGTKRSFRWVLNTSANPLDYQGPDGESYSLAAGSSDIWMDTDLAIGGIVHGNYSGTQVSDCRLRLAHTYDVTVVVDGIYLNDDLLPTPAGSAHLFFQDFESSSSVSGYVSSPAGSNQFDDISAETNGGTWSIESGKLKIQRIATTSGDNDDDAGLARLADLPVAGNPVTFRATLGFEGVVSDWSPLYYIDLGAWSSLGDYNSGGSYQDIYDQLTVRGGGTDSFRLTYGSSTSANIATGTGLSHVLSWTHNTGASSVQYEGPDGNIYSIAAGTSDIWVDTNLVFDDVNYTAFTGTQLSDFRIRFRSQKAFAALFDDVTLTDGSGPSGTGPIVDKLPVLTLIGGDIDLSLGEAYQEPGYVATDPQDGDVSDSVVESWSGATLDVNTPGTYLKQYQAFDSSGNGSSLLTRSITVEDSLGPTITLVGGDVYLDVGEAFIEPGYTAIDSIDGDVTAQVVESWNGTPLDVNLSGVYQRQYDVSDSQGNPAQTVYRSVIVASSALFTQSFGGSTVVGDYVSSPAQLDEFDDISAESNGGSWTISNGSLTIARVSTSSSDPDNDAGFARVTDLLSGGGAAVLMMDLEVEGVSSNWGPLFYLDIGSWSSVSDYSSGGAYGDLVERIVVKGGGTELVRLEQNGVSSANVAAGAGVTVQLFIALNDSASSVNYTGPDSSSNTLAAGANDIWINGSLAFDDVSVGSYGGSLTGDFRVRLVGGDAITVRFDSIELTDQL
ncbi:immunoglobulin-like domain-containing protein [Pelagicoccus mobilis]|uniref:DUF5011 domain-containing protein n=1 Tax=Pelagicoccus mobilis TaxID=415221 RepID=A0A934RTJ8_9BACT|nr:immunoglobulin-like domain-containing protein [Pelagicoccus mobilis]MBK1876116.1 DUF5011 domain-containing protein [Pelagicoccus mobilis]